MNHNLKIFLLSLCILLLIVVCAKKKEEPSIIVDNAISSDGVSIMYEVRGKGEPALVFVHGWGNRRSIWDTQVAHFSQKHKVVTIDLAGFGESGNDRKMWTMESFGDDVVAVVNKLSLKNVILIGFSMGAPVVLEAAKQLPEHITGVVLVDELHDIKKVFSQEEINNLILYLMDAVTEPTIEKLEPFFKKNREESFKRVTTMMKDVSKVGWSECLKDYFRWRNEDCVDSLKKIQAPLISINSDQPPTHVEAFKKYVPSFEAKIIPGVGHVVFWDAPNEFNRLLAEAVLEFIQMSKSR
ncbi:MAG: alpha/beta hydrolase [Candidatus Aminicenantes bacterium]|nr:MAG: alpha/beta hydrolase [Candidatus Aminicenantes bacterium]